MATATLGGRSFKLQGNTLTLFNVSATKSPQTELSSSEYSYEILRDEATQPLKYKIECVIEKDYAAGKAKEIDSVRIDVTTALQLWLDGEFKPGTFKYAKDDRSCVVIEMELYEGQNRKVEIYPDEALDFPYGTYNSSGEVIT